MIEFTIPAVPPSENDWSRPGRQHWSHRSRAREQWRSMAKLYAIKARIARPWLFKVPVVVTLSFRLPYGGDPDNRCKSVLDSLVHAGFIESDKAPHMTELRLRAQRGRPAETRVRIEEADGSGAPA